MGDSDVLCLADGWEHTAGTGDPTRRLTCSPIRSPRQCRRKGDGDGAVQFYRDRLGLDYSGRTAEVRRCSLSAAGLPSP
jgi:hypothetical protein